MTNVEKNRNGVKTHNEKKNKTTVNVNKKAPEASKTSREPAEKSQANKRDHNKTDKEQEME